MTPTRKATGSKNERKVAINVSLPASLHQRLRIKAIQNDQSLAEAVAAAVEAWTK